MNKEAVAGIQFLLGNLTPNQIRGAKMLMGIASVVNDDQIPTNNDVPNNTITGNPHTGWVQVKIDGNADLPIDPDPDGSGLAWTDLVAFSPNFEPDDGEIVWRIWVPNRSTAPYALSIAQGDPGTMAITSIRALARFQILIRGDNFYNGSSWMYYGWADGNIVTNPAASATWTVTTNPLNDFYAYSRPKVTATPILGYRWKANRSLPVIEMVGDSITQGYWDNEDGPFSVAGMPGRLIRELGSGSNAQYTFINFAASGYTPEQYLARWKGLAYADLTGGTALAYSIFSPNGFNWNDPAKRIEELKQNCIAAEQAAHETGRIFIPMFVTGTNMFFLSGANWEQDNTGYTKELVDWAAARYGNQFLDLHQVITYSGTVGPSMQDGTHGPNKYTADHTHPTTLGYETLGMEAVRQFTDVYNAARAAQAKP
ncbi:MAG: SGNH/GDSL hydrolase family protein [Verrucomicrobia bacterium]|nr:SGNH/GDSL hydrolase family protein [Verrucomicrobiota bacterium]